MRKCRKKKSLIFFFSSLFYLFELIQLTHSYSRDPRREIYACKAITSYYLEPRIGTFKQ